MKSIFEQGFSLAEVLITIGIIGIVSALTIPVLISKYKTKQYKFAAKRAYRVISDAYLRANNDGRFVHVAEGYFYGDTEENAGTPYSYLHGENFKVLSEYFNVAKVCFNNNAQECWVCNAEAAELTGSGAPHWRGCFRLNYAFIDSSGMAWYMYYNNERAIIVDTNGNKKPNQLGRDRFVFEMPEFNMSNDRMRTMKDTLEKGRWCPQGNCYFSSWVYSY